MSFAAANTSLWQQAAAGAGLEVLFGGILKLVIALVKENVAFGSTLRLIEATLGSLGPKLKQIEQLNLQFDCPEETQRLRELFVQGEALLVKCSKIKRYDLVRTPFYNQKLRNFDRSLQRYINYDMQVQMAVDLKHLKLESEQTNLLVKRQLKQTTVANSDSFRRSILVDVCSPRGLKVDPVGLEKPLTDLKSKLLKEEDRFIVLSAPGGCGKTTLALAICQEADVKDTFKDNIFFITVPKPPNLRVIAQRIFHHNGKELPEFDRIEEVADHLERLLRMIASESGPILLILDDIWSGSESILQNIRFRIANYRVLVTSRFEFPTFGCTYKLQPLSDEDAITLFRQSAALPDRHPCIPEEDVDKIVRSCKGFPLAISVVGSSLCGKSVAEWRKRANEWSTPAAIISNFEPLNCLQSSVDALNDNTEIKESYLDLGAFPEDQRIPATTIIDLWVGLHNLNDDDAIIYLDELAKRNLVDLITMRKDAGEDDGCYNEHLVMQHDLLREIALLQSNSGSIEQRKRLFIEISGNDFPEWCMDQQQIDVNANLLSITTDDTFSSNWWSMQATQVEALVLNFETKNYVLPEFIEGMTKLKVLAATNNNAYHAELTNLHLLGSLRSLKRIRLEKVTVPPFFLDGLQLMKLEKISLVTCNIHQAFVNSPTKISDAFPNLSEVEIDYCNDLEALPLGLCDLLQLKKLSVTNCLKLTSLPEEIGKLVQLEVLRLNSCINLKELPNTIGDLDRLRIFDLTDCFDLSKLPERIDGLKSLMKLHMMGCQSNCELPISILKLHQFEVICEEEMAMSWEAFASLCPNIMIRVRKEVPNLNWLYRRRRF
ncbi:hypothetical protein K2173_006081 [Erythroxylum novogranatense]|uniref:RPW8 domain-containing protein n=1 Tax=Erythroxylum novogranatense TaxID=1862640 RepID=A0AAV8TD68_9ROSI|nr:hypothetical protein K2173_006081 [Erythroxylum novogranatense]